MGKTKRAALYHRVSTKEQAKEGYSLSDQQDRTRSYAESKGYEVVGSYTDNEGNGKSSRDTANRLELQRLFADARAGKIDVVIVLHPDRLAGGNKAAGHISYVLEDECHCSIEYVLVKYEDESGELLRFFDAYRAGEELTTMRRRTHAGRVQKAKAGKAAPMPTPLYGYKYNLLTKLHDVEPSQAAIVRRVFELYASGVGPGSIAAMLNSEGIPTGKEGTKGWTTDRVSRLVTHEAYASGVRIANRFYGEKDGQVLEVL